MVGNVLNRATPDAVIEQGELRAVTYDIDVTALTAQTAPLLVSHTFGRVGATYPQFPDHAHYVNLYGGTELDEEVRGSLFPDILDAAHSFSAQERGERTFTRRHGVIRPMTPAEALDFVSSFPLPFEVFAIGRSDAPVEMYGVSIAISDAPILERHLTATAFALIWLTPEASDSRQDARPTASPSTRSR
jgi:hypothetical protein